jgi:hypothetical protein
MDLYIIALCVLTIMNVAIHLRVHYQLRYVPELSTIPTPPLDEWPSISIIVPACNEGLTIKEAMKKLLAIDYPNYQVIAINDRSTDDTGAILDQLAQRDDRLHVIHIAELPEGWLGKLNALHVGTQSATGEYLIYADADVHFKSDVLHRVMAYVVSSKLDYLSIFPRFIAPSFMLRATILSFSNLFISTTRARDVNRDQEGAYVGVGVFQLVKRAFFKETKGWAWLKLEIGDDMGLALLCHDHGARSRIIMGSDHLTISWYQSIKEIILGLEKNLFPVAARFSILRGAFVCLLTLGVLSAPLLLLMTSFWLVGVLSSLMSTALILMSKVKGIPWPERIVSQYTPIIIIIAMIRSMWKTTRQGGIIWRGTHYSTQTLKEGQRLKW